MFRIVRSGEVGIAIEYRTPMKLGAMPARKRGKQRPGGGIFLGNGGGECGCSAYGVTLEQRIEHMSAKPHSARIRVDGYLPDENFLWRGRRPVAGYPAQQPPIPLGHNAGGGKVRTLHQIAISGVDIQRRTIRNKLRN